mmetsp:Transcript_24155/g.65396  ORF Transcript_24155/g.65396 Transcript_24155/m.65396 type:complete len:257 (-) Transcript_24155:58-828(-)
MLEGVKGSRSPEDFVFPWFGIGEQEVVHVALGKLCAVIGLEEPDGRVPLRVVLVVLALAVKHLGPRFCVRVGLALLEEFHVKVHVLNEDGVEHVIHLLCVLEAAEEHGGREEEVVVVDLVTLVLLEEREPLAHLEQRAHEIVVVVAGRGQGLHINDAQLLGPEGEEVEAEHGQVKLGLGIPQGVEHLRLWPCIDVGAAHFAQAVGFETPRLHGGRRLCAFHPMQVLGHGQVREPRQAFRHSLCEVLEHRPVELWDG